MNTKTNQVQVTKAGNENAHVSARTVLMREISSIVKDMPADWRKMSQGQQNVINNRIRQVAGDVIAGIIDHIAADGRKVIKVKVDTVTIKDGVKVVLTAPQTSENVQDLGMASGKPGYFVPLDMADHMDAEELATDPDQPELTEAGEAEAADLTALSERLVITPTGRVCLKEQDGETRPLADCAEANLESLHDEFGTDDDADASDLETEILRQVREGEWTPVSNRPAADQGEAEAPAGDEAGDDAGTKA